MGEAMEQATAFFHACESGKGWAECEQYAHADATFSCQATNALPGPPVTDCTTVEAYTNWMAGVVANFGEAATYDLHVAAQQNDAFVFVGTFGGFSQYVYMISMDGDKVRSMTKIWNDAYAAQCMNAGK